MQDAEARVELEAELRQQLARQAAAHSDHLITALHSQRVKLEAEFEKRLIERVKREKQKMLDDVRTVARRVDAMKAAVDGQSVTVVFHSAFQLLMNAVVKKSFIHSKLTTTWLLKNKLCTAK